VNCFPISDSDLHSMTLESPLNFSGRRSPIPSSYVLHGSAFRPCRGHEQTGDMDARLIFSFGGSLLGKPPPGSRDCQSGFEPFWRVGYTGRILAPCQVGNPSSTARIIQS